jgi:hypothetical protein
LLLSVKGPQDGGSRTRIPPAQPGEQRAFRSPPSVPIPEAWMSLHALAYRRDISLQKLHEYFASDDAQTHATTTSTECGRCGARFTIVLMDKDDVGNNDYCDLLRRIITHSCASGQHDETYELQV